MNAKIIDQSITCLCNCGQATGPKSHYRSGHDATHVSNLLAAIAQSGDLSQANVNRYLIGLPSKALQIKLQNAVDRLALRRAAKVAGRGRGDSRFEWVDSDTDDYRVGRWLYPVQIKMVKEDRLLAGEDPSAILDSRRNTKRDGSGEWVKLEGGELVGR